LYELPPTAGGDEGLEGFAVEVEGRRAGRVAALNSTPDGLVVLVDTGSAYRPVPARFLEQIETLGQRVRLTPEGEEAFAAAPGVEPRVAASDAPGLVRYVPRELDRLLVAGEPERTRHSPLWYVGGLLAVVGGIGAMAGAVPAAEGTGGSLRWLWIAVPVALFAAGLVLLWAALGRERSTGEKASEAATAILGISPRTRRRG
jgi:hypothetical protein